ncbi:MAG: glycosyltransferase family 4 protein [Patescibacteria group bacterium]
MNEGALKPRILVFSTSYFPFVGGAEVAVQNIAKKLKDRFEFFIITSRFKKDLPKIERVREGTVVRLGFGTALDKYFLPVLGILWSWRKQGILFGLDISTGSLAVALLKFFQPRRFFIFNIQYGYGDKRLAGGRFGLVNFAFRLMLSQADYVTAISNYLLGVARKYGYQGKAEVIPNGVENLELLASLAGRRTLKFETNSKTIITVSRLVPKNGVDVLIRAIAKVKEKNLNVKCLILGDGPERNKLEQMTKDYGLKTNIEFVGNVSVEKVYEYLSVSDVFVRPSRSEGMGNAFLEALSAKVPIIGTPIGGIPDFLIDGKTGLFCKTEDPKDLAEKILILLKNEQLAKSIVENGQKMIKEKFLWDGIAEKYENLFNLAQSLKILIATGIFPPDIGGPATYSKILLDELPKHGIDTRVLSFGSIRYLPKVIRHLAYGLKLIVQSRNCDLIFAQDPVSVGLPAALVSKILRKKFLLKVVGDYAWEQHQIKNIFVTPDAFQNVRYDFVTELRRKIQKFVARNAEKIIVPSNYLKKIVSMWGIEPSKTFVIYNAFESPLAFARGSKEEVKKSLDLPGKIIVSAGRLVPWKGFDVLIDIFNNLSKKFEDLKLVIIGSGPEEETLKLKITDYGPKTVLFTGSLTRARVLKYLSATDVFALNTAYEGFSHQILEAMALGVPIVTTNIGGNPEIIKNGENGFLVEFNNKEDFQEKISELLNNRNLSEKFSQNAKAAASQFTKERMINETIKILKSI